MRDEEPVRFDHKSFATAKAFGGSFAKQRAERSECRDEHHCASEFNSSLVHPATLKSAIRKGCVFFVVWWRARTSSEHQTQSGLRNFVPPDVERNGLAIAYSVFLSHCVRNGLLENVWNII